MENIHNRAVSNSEVVQPDVRIPKNHELDPREINGLVQTYRSEYVRLNPNPNSFTLDRAVADFKTQILRSSATVLKVVAEQDARQAERDAAAKAEADRRAAAEQAERDKANETERRTHLATWKANGGSEAEFDSHWPTMRLRLLEEKTLAAQQERRAKAAQTWRG